jgi:hypothetical protein
MCVEANDACLRFAGSLGTDILKAESKISGIEPKILLEIAHPFLEVIRLERLSI